MGLLNALASPANIVFVCAVTNNGNEGVSQPDETRRAQRVT